VLSMARPRLGRAKCHVMDVDPVRRPGHRHARASMRSPCSSTHALRPCFLKADGPRSAAAAVRRRGVEPARLGGHRPIGTWAKNRGTPPLNRGLGLGRSSPCEQPTWRGTASALRACSKHTSMASRATPPSSMSSPNEYVPPSPSWTLRRHSSMCRSAVLCTAASAVAMWVSARPYQRLVGVLDPRDERRGAHRADRRPGSPAGLCNARTIACATARAPALPITIV
jgi:hypothetical protein